MLIGERAAGLTSDTGETNGAAGSGTRGVLAISNPSLREAIEVLEKAWAAVAAVETSSLDDADHRALMVRMETLTRAMHGTSHTWLTELIESDGLAVLPERTNASRLAGLLLVDPGVAGKRIKIAQRMAPRRAMTGETLEPEYPTTAAAHTAGTIDAAHVNVIDEFFRHLPAEVDHESKVKSENLLGNLARKVLPEQLRVAAARLHALLDEDGELKNDKNPASKCFFRLGKQGVDGLSKGNFLIDAEFRAYLEPILAKLAKPGNCNPEETKPVVDDNLPAPQNQSPDETERTGNGTGGGSGGGTDTAEAGQQQARAGRDLRSQGQRNHDAVKAVLRQMLASGSLGTHRGLPVTAVISMTARELQQGCGHAVTGTGSLVSIRDAIRMASHAHQYLAIFDDDGRALYLGRSKRIASADQRIVLMSRDRGCTFPACTRPATWSQVHHITEWALGGPTDVDSLTFGCDVHHPLVGDGPNDWATTTTGPEHRHPGRTQWHPPAAVDPNRRGLINHHHHPHEYLYPSPDDPDPNQPE
ncbi:HNH endonuclease signature motif containing protein [Rhodococcus sp. I2R]|uniref:HNH endonuclease signature motif containing protein n=1 Tax=Rhodococcus sp. I2R TaxID=2855445 RepID=UPI001E368556|nr:HNH endonuclease signature motif containing protein [Rhodococcus sp. I2R]MCC8927477.1 HNH endonuclease [Rhodococcus sp. I2R]